MRETQFQNLLKKRLQKEFPGCIVLRNDPQQIQGIPDLLVLFESHWAALEVKDAFNAPQQPNQEYYVEKMNEMSFATFVCPENVEEVIRGLQGAFRHSRSPRFS
jgi:hypothetical protein